MLNSTLFQRNQDADYDKETININEINKFRRQETQDNLSQRFFEEVRFFCERNAIRLPHQENKVCLRCLKAHILTLTGRIKIKKATLSMLIEKMPCEIGHDSYYLDKDIVKRVDHAFIC